jgi:hypothetical protein
MLLAAVVQGAAHTFVAAGMDAGAATAMDAAS